MNGVFVDTGAWFARFVSTDPDHAAAKSWLDSNAQSLSTTDHVVDELLTLQRIRGEYLRALEIDPRILRGKVCDLEWVTPLEVGEAWTVRSTFQHKGWGFADCLSRVVRVGWESPSPLPPTRTSSISRNHPPKRVPGAGYGG